MVKLVHDPMMKMVFNFVKKCLYEEDIPTGIKLERMALLYKNAGDLNNNKSQGVMNRQVHRTDVQEALGALCLASLHLEATTDMIITSIKYWHIFTTTLVC